MGKTMKSKTIDRETRLETQLKFARAARFRLPSEIVAGSRTYPVRLYSYYVRTGGRHGPMAGCVVFGEKPASPGVWCRGVSLVSEMESNVCRKYGQRLAYKRWMSAMLSEQTSDPIERSSSGKRFMQALRGDLFRREASFEPACLRGFNVQLSGLEASIVMRAGSRSTKEN